MALVVFGKLILHKGAGKEIAEQVTYFIANALLLQSWIPWRDGYFSFNAVSWYLSTTAFSYFLFPWIFEAIQSKDKKRKIRLVASTLGSMVIVAIILGIGKQNFGWTKAIIKYIVYICPLYRAGDFIIGLTVGYIFVSAKNVRRKGLHTTIQILVIVLMTVQVFIYSSGISNAINWMLSLFWLPTSVMCVYLFAVNKGAFSKILSKSKVIIWIGNISGEAFLIHQICIKAAECVMRNKWIVAAVSFVATLICTVIWRYLYSMFMQKTSRKKRQC